ncbi:autotransporter outer membrane beta-barrel domain-containing protein [Halorubrum ezzemoulense]|uniref:hypothetical protein n=1 Tax=Halorubrum ezzemoulense TaxID=337243 RepID=UPI00211AC7B2|nr:hypothetical protein [Halorubrum ezzemoulense]
MRVETTTVDGEPALNLSDDRTHDGRWVAVPTEWFKGAYGEVPSVARIAHEDSGTYTEPLQVRGDSAAFYVRGFSTNTVTFGGELVIRDRPAVDGTRHTYQLDSRDSVDNVSINLTGVENTGSASTRISATDGDTLPIDVGGTSPPRDETVTLTGVEETSSGSLSPGTVSDGYSTTIGIGGNQPARGDTVTLTGYQTTNADSASTAGATDGTTLSYSVGGNQQPQDASVTFTGYETTQTRTESGSSATTRALTITGNQEPTGPQNGEPEISVQTNPGTTDHSLSDTGDSEVVPNDWDSGEYTVSGSSFAGSEVTVELSVNSDLVDSKTVSPVLEEANFEFTDVNLEPDDLVTLEVSNDREIDYTISGTTQPGSATITTDTGQSTTLNSDGSAPLDLTGSESEITITESGAGISSWSLEYEDTTQTEDPSLTIDGETVTHNGLLAQGESVTKPITSLSPGAGSATISVSGQVDVSASWTEVTATEDPSVTVGGSTVSHSGVLGPGETVTESVDLSPGSNSVDMSVNGPVGFEASWTEVTATEDPSVTVGGSTVSHSGVLGDGETVSESVDLSTGSQSADISVNGPVDVSASWTEVSQTRDPVVELNGESVGYSGTLNDGETVSLDAKASWVREGTNNITVSVGDGSYSGAGPEPKVELEYRHDLESPRTVLYESEALTERYNVTKTYTNQIADATLRIPHARDVFSMRSVEYRLNESGSWSSVPQYATNLSGTTLSVDVSEVAGNPVPAGTTVEIRSAGSRVDVRDGEISVQRATPVGFDLNSRIQLDSWSSGSYLEVGETAQGELTHYATNESYPTESDYVELYSDGEQRFYAPNATSGSTLTLQTLSARVSPDQNSMRVRVPDGVNATSPRFVVEPASVVGDSWSVEYVAGTDGEYYAAVDKNGDRLGGAEKPSAIDVSRDDVGLVEIVAAEPPTPGTDTVGGGVFATLTTGNLPSLTVLFGGVAMLFVAGTRPAASRDAIDGLGASLGGVVGQVPRVGPALGSALESAVSSVGNALVSVGENRLLSGAIAAAVAVAAGQAGLYQVGSEAGAILAVGGIAVGSLYVLREAGEFTTARWIAIVAVAGVVAIQGLGEGDLLTQFVNSDAFLIAVLMGGYAVIQLVREYRQNNDPNDDRPQIVIGGRFNSGDDQEGSD